MKKISLIERVSNLETIEEKSFWVIAPVVCLLGLAGLTTSGSYGSVMPTIVSAVLCLFIPIILMLLVKKYHNYHSAYPLLVILIGGISVPITFVFGGGFLSGMPLFCVVSTCISALCYSKKWRYFALSCCILGNCIAFYYVYNFGTPFPLTTNKLIYDDILFGYFFASLAAFVSINMIIVEVRKYRVSQDVLQQYFDTQVRKEILEKALKGDLSLKTGHRKAVIAFIDISNFTTISENMDTDLVAKFLNEFFSIAGKHIHDADGTIDKYIGDCVMAYWFAENDEHVNDAVNAILNIRKEINEKAEDIYRKYKTELNFSAGVSYGDIIFGDIGSDTMHDYTIIGDAVNTASRLQDYAVAGELLVSDSVASCLKNNFTLQLVDNDMYFKGKHNAINLYRVLDNKPNENLVVNKRDVSGYSLYICGCRGSFPVSGIRFSEYGGETSCYVVKKNDYAIIVDCGTGLKNAVEILADCRQIDILLTHVHYDHILGLLMAKLPESANVRLFMRSDSWKNGKDTLNSFMTHPYWPVYITSMETVNAKIEEPIELKKNIFATFYESDHPDSACVIKLMCEDKKICFFSDCEDVTKLNPEISFNSDLLFYDGMFDAQDTIDHTGWGHGTWQDGVKFAQNQNIKKLIITHHNPEIGDHTLQTRETIAREQSANISFAKTGDRYFI